MDFKNKAFWGLSIFILFFTSCDPADNRLNIENRSGYPIYYTYSANETLDENEVRIGIGVDPYDNTKTPNIFYLISPKSMSTAALTSDKWEGIASESKDGKIYFFFFFKDTLLKYAWREIVKGKKYAGTVSYEIDDLKKMGWKITYPIKNSMSKAKNMTSEGTSEIP